MPLKTEYNNPDVILTTALTGFQRNLLKYVKCGSLIVITFFISALSLYIGVLLSLAIWGVLILWTGSITKRPEVIMNVLDNTLEIIDLPNTAQKRFVNPAKVERVMIQTKPNPRWEKIKEHTKDKRLKNLYFPQLVVKEGDPSNKDGNTAKKTYINCFILEDILQAHYMAQLLASYTNSHAFDFKGKKLPPLKSYVPTRYR